MTLPLHVSRSYKFGSATNDAINTEIANLKAAGYELVSFEDDRTTNNLYFGFRQAHGERTPEETKP